jgi:endonuclease YncB( thermonuclease family)
MVSIVPGLRNPWLLAVAGISVLSVSSCEWLRFSLLFADRRECIVEAIHDGDTMRLTCAGGRVKVRLHCIDAPELRQRPWGRESREHLRAIATKRVILIAKERDRYRRIVGEVLKAEGRESLNLQQVRSGHAAVYYRYCSDPWYYFAQQAAKAEHAGVWARPGEHQAPWRTRY